MDERFILSEETHDDWNSLSDSLKDVEDLKMAIYSAMVDRVDQKIGEILKKLEALGELDNTLILFMSDNGSSAEMVNIPRRQHRHSWSLDFTRQRLGECEQHTFPILQKLLL